MDAATDALYNMKGRNWGELGQGGGFPLRDLGANDDVKKSRFGLLRI